MVKRLLQLALLAAGPLMAQPPQLGLGYHRVSGPASTVSIPAGAKYASGSPLTGTTCSPKAHAKVCVVKGVVLIRKAAITQSITVTEGGNTIIRTVPSVHPDSPPCPPGLVHSGHGPACMLVPR